MTDVNAPKPYRIEVEVPASRDDVWVALTQPELVRQWFGWDHPGLDDEIQQIFVDLATLNAARRMGWADGSYLEADGDDDRSVVRAVRESAGDPQAYDGIEEGWRAFLHQLRFLFEQRPTGPRRTLHLTGTATGADAVKAVGDGRTVHESARQRALVDADGHLVVVASQAEIDSADTSRVEVTVSAYGLDDAAFAALRDRWADRWLPVARDAEVTAGRTAAPEPSAD
jgi:uncharacterized protein YndB with AHSA1/START domain